MSSPVATPHKSPNSYGWAWLVLIAFIVSVFIFSGNRSGKNIPEKTKSDTENSAKPKTIRISKDKKWKVVSPPTKIRFTGEYGEAFKGVLRYDNISIEDLTEPCCLKTTKGKEYCSDGTKNFGKNIIPYSKDNQELYFKSQNGKTGYLNIYFWIPN